MIKFFATIEFLSGQRAAILTLTNEAGEWAGSGRIEVPSGLHSDLYEEAYRQASLNAQAKGGRLERFSEAAPEDQKWQHRCCTVPCPICDRQEYESAGGL